MGSSQTNKWVMDQIMENIDAVEICKKFIEVYESLNR